MFFPFETTPEAAEHMAPPSNRSVHGTTDIQRVINMPSDTTPGLIDVNFEMVADAVRDPFIRLSALLPFLTIT